MNRQETIKTLQQIAAEIAQEMGYTEMRVGEDRQKGVWGEGFTRYLEETLWNVPRKSDGLNPMHQKIWHSVTTSNFHSVSANRRSVLATGNRWSPCKC